MASRNSGISDSARPVTMRPSTTADHVPLYVPPMIVTASPARRETAIRLPATRSAAATTTGLWQIAAQHGDRVDAHPPHAAHALILDVRPRELQSDPVDEQQAAGGGQDPITLPSLQRGDRGLAILDESVLFYGLSRSWSWPSLSPTVMRARSPLIFYCD